MTDAWGLSLDIPLGRLDVVGPKLIDIRGTDEFHGAFELVVQETERLVNAPLAGCAQAVQIGPANHAGRRSHGHGFHDVGAAADPSIDQDLNLATNRIDGCR